MNRDRFHGFREDIVLINQNVPAQRSAQTEEISKPAETVLLKRLQQLGFVLIALDVSHIGGGVGLYLLELVEQPCFSVSAMYVIDSSTCPYRSKKKRSDLSGQ